MPQKIEPHYADERVTLFHGDCREVMSSFDDASIDAIVTDPPYELAFMGKRWDASGIAYDPVVWGEALRVLKPGGHLLAFGGTRTWHRLAVAIEDADFEVRDSIAWMYGSGFPKSHNLKDDWQGWGTALKPAFEPIVVARKPLDGTVAENVLRWGTGALNIDGSRVGTEVLPEAKSSATAGGAHIGQIKAGMVTPERVGRWPANVILDESQAAELDRQSGWSQSPPTDSVIRVKANDSIGTLKMGDRITPNGHGDSGGASRFFYVPKANKRERPNVDGVAHPTVKPLALMRYLINLVTPPDGTVLDPFTGSGATIEAAILEGKQSIGIELTDEYLPLIRERISRQTDGKLL